MPENAAKPSGPSGEGAAKPSRIGGFELLATLGKGGMGTVFKARQVSMDRLVALKVLPPNLAKNQDFVQRFLREARSAAKLNHTNIVQGFDVGEADGVYYFAMEFVDGPTLKDLIKREGRIEEKKALNILGGVARALEHAHKHGLIHRDIKPDNVMVSRDGVVKLADLGLAKSTLPRVSIPREGKPEEGKYEDTVTLEGTTLGTPHYMAPEQVRGQSDLDTRCDIYALGATLYHMVTGAFPFEGPNAAAIMAKHLAEEPPNPREKNPQLSRPTCDLILRMMAKDPADRPQTPTELLGEIRDALEGKVKLRSVATRTLHPPAHGGTEGGPAGKQPPPQPSPRAGRERVHFVHSVHDAKRPSVLPWLLAAAAVLAAGALFLILRPGNPAQPQATEKKEDLTAKDAKNSSLPRAIHGKDPREGKAEESATHAEADRQLAELKSACDALIAKDHFGQALARLDAFGNNLPRVSDPREVTSSLPRVSDPSSLPKAIHEKHLREGIPALRSSLLSKAEERYTELARAADAAIEAKDYPKARAALAPAEAFGIPELADRAKKKLEEIASREKSAEAWAKWDGVKSQAKKLADAGQFDDALKLLDGAKAIPLDKIADLVAEQMESIESTKSILLKAALAAYAAESDKVWALFKERKYADADKLLAALAASLPKVSHLREGIALPLQADQEAAKLLKEFWAAVEKGLAAKAGQFISFKSAAGGTLLAVQDGAATVKTPKGEEPRRVQDLVAKQALAHADLKDDPHSNLLKGVFLLAEGEDHLAAEKAFAAAGDEAKVARYKERLAALAPPKAATPPETTPKVEPGPTGKWEVYKDWPFSAAEAARRQRATGKALGVKVEQDIDLGGGVKRTFVLIPAGEFMMGSPPTTTPEKLAAAYGGDPKEFEGEFPQHRVKISRPFWIGKYLVTQEQWFSLFQTKPSAFKDKPKNPVDNVDWNGAHRFANGLSEKLGKTFRIPTEAEWEYACRAGTATEFYFGNEAAKVADFGWCGVKSTAPVGMKKPNAWGLYDMAGNICEWCEDWYGKYESGAQTDPKGAVAGEFRVLRGGSWNYLHRLLRSAFRLPDDLPGRRNSSLGFRVALAVLAQEPQEAPKVAAEDLKAGQWVSLFDGKSLKGWRMVAEFQGHGEVSVVNGTIELGKGRTQTGISWEGNVPRENYELTLDAMRLEGSDSVCSFTFPVGQDRCSFLLGWLEGTVGIGEVDAGLGMRDPRGDPALGRKGQALQSRRWYTVRIRVTPERLEAWFDGERIVEVPRQGRRFRPKPEYEALGALGIQTWQTTGAVRNIRLRRLGE